MKKKKQAIPENRRSRKNWKDEMKSPGRQIKMTLCASRLLFLLVGNDGKKVRLKQQDISSGFRDSDSIIHISRASS